MSASMSPTRSIETLAPFRRSPESRAGIAAKIDGKIPDWLRELVAMTEGNRQLVIDDGTLAAVRPVGYSQDALSGAIMSAHPHFDFERAKGVNVATEFSVGGVISI